jgi:hypothetical protein
MRTATRKRALFIVLNVAPMTRRPGAPWCGGGDGGSWVVWLLAFHSSLAMATDRNVTHPGRRHVDGLRGGLDVGLGVEENV